MPRRPVVTFLSDFGAGSGYPAQMKGEVLRLLPDATLVDLSHEVPPFDVLAGALLLEACVPRFPEGAVHVAVVDPGVGTSRRPLCVVDGAGRRLVGPDNGLLTPFLGAGSAAFLLSDPELVPRDPSPTFHGRDLFAPVAAWLAGGGDPARLGPRVADPRRMDGLSAARGPCGFEGTCLAADPFGNLVTSVRRADLGAASVAGVTVDGTYCIFINQVLLPDTQITVVDGAGSLTLDTNWGDEIPLIVSGWKISLKSCDTDNVLCGMFK